MLVDKKLQILLEPTITALGYELIGVVKIGQGRNADILRIYIDHPNGINLNDCEQVSHQVSGILEVADFQNNYNLEVSSAGLDRPLFTLAHFMQFIGHKVKINMFIPIQKRRKFNGSLERVVDNNIIVMVDNIEYSLPYEQISKAHIVLD
ncbi:MAG: ribosome maturation factor RimP [Thiomargarita sp.]|nr:ribosome maturation factor RimP [Thiomargarita sp.]